MVHHDDSSGIMLFFILIFIVFVAVFCCEFKKCTGEQCSIKKESGDGK